MVLALLIPSIAVSTYVRSLYIQDIMDFEWPSGRSFELASDDGAIYLSRMQEYPSDSIGGLTYHRESPCRPETTHGLSSTRLTPFRSFRIGSGPPGLDGSFWVWDFIVIADWIALIPLLLLSAVIWKRRKLDKNRTSVQ